MVMNRLKSAILITLISVGFPAIANDNPTSTSSYLLDLAHDTSKTIEVTEKKSVQLTIINLAPKYRNQYLISTDIEKVDIPKFQNPGGVLAAIAEPPPKKPGENAVMSIDLFAALNKSVISCNAIGTAVNEFLNIDQEKKVSSGILTLQKVVNDNEVEAGKDCVNIKKAEQGIAGTRLDLTVNLKRNSNTKVTVTLAEDSYIALIKPEINTWVTHVGFGFSATKDGHSYTDKSTTTVDGTTTTNYTITKESDVGGYQYSALAMFSLPMKRSIWGSDIDLGFTTGLASTDSAVTVMIGGSAIFQENFVLTAGVIAKQTTVLGGKYKVGNISTEAIDSSTLETKTYKPAFIVVLSYRFGT